MRDLRGNYRLNFINLGATKMFTEITMLDYSKPLAHRAKARKTCGPYRWTPRNNSNEGFGFYCGNNDLVMDRHGSICDLRLESANDLLPSYSRTSHVDGYFCDSDCNETLKPIVARLPKKRGFLAGWTLGAQCCAELSTHVFDEPADAALSAHDEAERAAERWIEAEERDREEQEEE
jgi:hypothetical protein